MCCANMQHPQSDSRQVSVPLSLVLLLPKASHKAEGQEAAGQRTAGQKATGLTGREKTKRMMLQL